MVIRVYVSGISGNKEVKKRQQRVTMILDGKNIKYTVIDIAEPGNENDKEFMQENSKTRDSKYPLPPQIFNGDNYCGDYEDFDMANELDELEKFLKTSVNSDNLPVVENGISNGSKGIGKEDHVEEDIIESLGETVSSENHSNLEASSSGNDTQTSSEQIRNSDLDPISNEAVCEKNADSDPEPILNEPACEKMHDSDSDPLKNERECEKIDDSELDAASSKPECKKIPDSDPDSVSEEPEFEIIHHQDLSSVSNEPEYAEIRNPDAGLVSTKPNHEKIHESDLAPISDGPNEIKILHDSSPNSDDEDPAPISDGPNGLTILHDSSLNSGDETKGLAEKTNETETDDSSADDKSTNDSSADD